MAALGQAVANRRRDGVAQILGLRRLGQQIVGIGREQPVNMPVDAALGRVKLAPLDLDRIDLCIED